MSATYQLSLFDVQEFNVSPKPSLQSILASLDSIPYLNWGGCGVAALAIYRWCKKNGVEVSDRPFVFLWREDDEWEVQHNDELLENGELDRVEAPAHVAIELFDGLYDSEGCECSDLLRLLPLYQEYKLNEAELLAVVNNIGEWNSTFSRSKNIGKIELALSIDLSDVRKH